MKTVMKKLLSVMLVALLLVSAVPFAVSADEGYTYTLVADGYSFDIVDADGKVTAAELYDALELSKGDDAGVDAWIAGKSFPIDVTSGKVVLSVTASSGSNGGSTGGSNTGSGSTTTPGNGGNGEAKPEVAPTTTVSLTIDYKLDGYTVKTVKATKGKLFKEYVGIPARNGYNFVGWKSSNGGYIDIENDKVEADVTITAEWTVNKYFLTFDENRGAEEAVSSGKTVTFDQPIGKLPTPSKRDGYVFVGWKLNGTIITADTIYVWPGDNTAYAEWKLESDTEGEPMNPGHTADGKVYLEIYANGKTDKYVKRVEITKYADDNKITRSEVEPIAKKYVTAKTGYSLAFEGLFDEESWWWYVRDNETNGAASVVVNKDGDDVIYVMVNNVKNVSDKPADTTNPQTGDAIGITLAIMMCSGGAALTLGKKKF